VTQIVLHLRTKNDSNGNPRRLYLPLDPERTGSTAVTHVIKEGYRGHGALTAVIGHKGHKEIGIEVPIREYNDWVRYGKDQDILVP